MKRLVCLAPLLLLLHSGPAADELRPGQPFPEVYLPRALEGSPDSILHYRGKKTIVHIFASW